MHTWVEFLIPLFVAKFLTSEFLIRDRQFMTLSLFQFGVGLLIGGGLTVLVCDRFLVRRLQDLVQKTALSDRQSSTDSGLLRSATLIRKLEPELQQVMAYLNQTLETLTQTTTVKDRMEEELSIGRNIQMNMLTLTLPHFPKRKDLELDAALKPARELGGDFYDFYFFREHTAYLFEQKTFCFCIGDVSGKGVPAALFMAVVKILMKAQADIHLFPSKIVTEVNQALSADNPDCMFATLFFGRLNLTTGELVYTNAGHNPPYIRRQDGSVDVLERGHGPAIGVIEGVQYREGRTNLGYGDLLFCYTDGITEAMDGKDNLFSEERLSTLITSGHYTSASELLQLVYHSVLEFQGEAEQADDITMLALQFLGHPEAIERASELAIRDDVLSLLREEWQ